MPFCTRDTATCWVWHAVFNFKLLPNDSELVLGPVVVRVVLVGFRHYQAGWHGNGFVAVPT